MRNMDVQYPSACLMARILIKCIINGVGAEVYAKYQQRNLIWIRFDPPLTPVLRATRNRTCVTLISKGSSQKHMN
jgi:hypothetical protein